MMESIDSADISEMQDASSADLIQEIESKLQHSRLLPLALILGTLAIVVALYALQYWAFLLAPPVVLLAWFIHQKDELASTVVLMYDLEGDSQTRYEGIVRAFENLKSCAGKWHIPERADVIDRKYNAGAAEILSRTRLDVRIGVPRRMRSNIDFPSVSVGSQALYFLPDRILVYSGNRIGAIAYPDFRVDSIESRFIETESVPHDSRMVDRTWRYVNKKGGPDGRFRDNPELPIMLYENIRLSSTSGLNELLMVSKPGVGKQLSTSTMV